MWDLRSSTLVQQYKSHAGAVTSLAFHPTGNFLLTSALDATLKVGMGGLGELGLGGGLGGWGLGGGIGGGLG